MDLSGYLNANTLIRCIVENASGDTLSKTVWSRDSFPKLYAVSRELSNENPFPFPTVKLLYDLNYPAPSSVDYASRRILQGYVVTGRDIRPLLHVAAYVRGRIGPFAMPAGPGVGHDGFAWILTLNPDDEINDFSISQIKEFIGEQTAYFKLFPPGLPEQAEESYTDCNCAIS
jgi:hypothetical protein